MASYALLDAAGVWQNTIVWDGASAYAPQPGWTLHDVASLPVGGAIGATLANGAWTAAPAPAPPTQGLTFLQFMALFAPAEQAAIVASADAQVKLFTLMASGASGAISLTNPEVVAGVGYLASIGLVTAARAAAILTGAAPA